MRDETYKRISNSFLLTLMRAVYLFIPGIIFLSLYYFIIVKIDIGQDMLMQANENLSPYLFTIISILVWMLFSWFSSRLIADAYEEQCNPPHKKIFEHFPRLIAYNVAVCLQLAVLNLPTVAALNKGIYILLALHNAYYFLLNRLFTATKEYRKRKQTLLIVSCVAAAAYIVYLISAFPEKTPVIRNVNEENLHLRGSFLVIIIFFIFQIAFVAFAVWRRKLIEKNKSRSSPRWNNNSKAWRKSYNVFAAVVLGIYILILESTKFADAVGAIGITILAFGLWVGLICIIKYATIKFNSHFWLPLLAIAIVYGMIYNPYKVRLEKTPIQHLYSERKNLDTFFDKWVNNPVRRDSILKDTTGKPYTVYLVIADGGASKSGYWVADVLSKLEDSSAATDRFSNHLFSLAGASGGSVGNAAFYSLLKANMAGRSLNDSLESRRFFEADFFSSSFARFLGPDLIRHIVPLFFMDDRAAVLEESMEGNSNSKTIDSIFSQPIRNVFDYSGRLPALFVNTTNLQSGSPGVVSNIYLDSQVTERLDILRLLDTAKELRLKNGLYENDMRFSTGVILGARFPYISPAGGIAGKYFVDGGYFDNSGAGITLEVLQYIESKMNTDSCQLFAPYKKSLAFKIIYVSNGSGKSSDHDLHPLVNDAAAPLLTVLGTYGSQTNLANSKLFGFLKNTTLTSTTRPYEIINLPMDKADTLVPYPLNWVISKYNLDRMNRNLDSVHPYKILQ